MRRPLLGVALFVCAVPCCTTVLSLDQFEDAVAALCKCDEDVPQYEGACIDVLSERLDGVSEPTRQAWLEAYARDCHGECLNAFACYQVAGTCAKVACTENRECCGYVSEGGGMVCVEEECKSCSGPDQPCDEAEDCCEGSVCQDEICREQ